MLVSGLRPSVYWAASFLRDLLMYTVPFIVSLILIAAFGVRGTSSAPVHAAGAHH